MANDHIDDADISAEAGPLLAGSHTTTDRTSYGYQDFSAQLADSVKVFHEISAEDHARQDADNSGAIIDELKDGTKGELFGVLDAETSKKYAEARDQDAAERAAEKLKEASPSVDKEAPREPTKAEKIIASLQSKDMHNGFIIAGDLRVRNAFKQLALERGLMEETRNGPVLTCTRRQAARLLQEAQESIFGKDSTPIHALRLNTLSSGLFRSRNRTDLLIVGDTKTKQEVLGSAGGIVDKLYAENLLTKSKEDFMKEVAANDLAAAATMKEKGPVEPKGPLAQIKENILAAVTLERFKDIPNATTLDIKQTAAQFIIGSQSVVIADREHKSQQEETFRAQKREADEAKAASREAKENGSKAAAEAGKDVPENKQAVAVATAFRESMATKEAANEMIEGPKGQQARFAAALGRASNLQATEVKTLKNETLGTLAGDMAATVARLNDGDLKTRFTNAEANVKMLLTAAAGKDTEVSDAALKHIEQLSKDGVLTADQATRATGLVKEIVASFDDAGIDPAKAPAVSPVKETAKETEVASGSMPSAEFLESARNAPAAKSNGGLDFNSDIREAFSKLSNEKSFDLNEATKTLVKFVNARVDDLGQLDPRNGAHPTETLNAIQKTINQARNAPEGHAVHDELAYAQQMVDALRKADRTRVMGATSAAQQVDMPSTPTPAATTAAVKQASEAPVASPPAPQKDAGQDLRMVQDANAAVRKDAPEPAAPVRDTAAAIPASVTQTQINRGPSVTEGSLNRVTTVFQSPAKALLSSSTGRTKDSTWNQTAIRSSILAASQINPAVMRTMPLAKQAEAFLMAKTLLSKVRDNTLPGVANNAEMTPSVATLAKNVDEMRVHLKNQDAQVSKEFATKLDDFNKTVTQMAGLERSRGAEPKPDLDAAKGATAVSKQANATQPAPVATKEQTATLKPEMASSAAGERPAAGTEPVAKAEPTKREKAVSQAAVVRDAVFGSRSAESIDTAIRNIGAMSDSKQLKNLSATEKAETLVALREIKDAAQAVYGGYGADPSAKKELKALDAVVNQTTAAYAKDPAVKAALGGAEAKAASFKEGMDTSTDASKAMDTATSSAKPAATKAAPVKSADRDR